VESIITLTKHAHNIVGSDVPPDGGAGAPEFVTREMQEAGASVIEDWKAEFPDTFGATLLAERVYIAMVAVSTRLTRD
jgi:hypothetical protein